MEDQRQCADLMIITGQVDGHGQEEVPSSVIILALYCLIFVLALLNIVTITLLIMVTNNIIRSPPLHQDGRRRLRRTKFAGMRFPIKDFRLRIQQWRSGLISIKTDLKLQSPIYWN